jgi:nucleoid-associated protein YgaU
MDWGASGIESLPILETIEMSKSYCPFLYGKFRRFFQLAAIAVTLSAAACAGSSDQSEEPIAAEDGETSDAMAGEEGSGLIIEQDGSEETAQSEEVAPEATEMSEDGEDDSMMATAEAETVSSDEYTAPEETAAPAETPVEETAAASTEEAPESLDSTLDDAVSAQPVAAESFEDTTSEAAVDSSADAMLDEAASTPSMASTGNFGQSSGILPPGVIASPGAAIFIKSKYEKSDSTASSSSSGSGSSSGHSYVVERGDTVSGISRKIYGSFGHWKKLASKNGISAPYILLPGSVIKYDADTSLAKAFASGKKVSGMNTFKVKHGDTLSKIASEVYGTSGSWKTLYEMNKDKISNPNHIHVGMVLSFGGKSSVAKAKKASVSKKADPAPVKKVEEPAVVAAPETTPEEAPAAVEAPAEEEVPAAVVVEDEAPEAAPVAEEEVEETINVDLPTEEEE